MYIWMHIYINKYICKQGPKELDEGSTLIMNIDICKLYIRMLMYLYIYIYAYIYICIHIYIYIYIYMYIHVYIYIWMHIYVNKYICKQGPEELEEESTLIMNIDICKLDIRILMYLYIYTYIYIYAYMYTYTYKYVYTGIHMYIWMHIYVNKYICKQGPEELDEGGCLESGLTSDGAVYDAAGELVVVLW
jgi:hypothetical protein